MFSTLTMKSWTDLKRRPARAILTALTISLAVASFGILALPSLMNQAMTTEVANARLYDVSVPVDDVVLSPAQMSGLAQLPNVVSVVSRTFLNTGAMIGGQRVATELWGVPNFAEQPLDRVITASRPGPGQVLVDVQDVNSGIYSGSAGDTLRLQASDGSFHAFVVAGSARAMAFNQGTASNHLVLYAAQATVQALGGFKGINHLEFRLRDTSPAAAHKTVAEVRGFLAAQPDRTAFSDVPTIRAANDWPGKQAFDSRTEILVILTVLAVLSAAFLLANTIRTMIAEQAAETGIMRAVGASRRNIRRCYLRTAALLGLLGAGIGVPLGVGLAYLLVGLFARSIFGVSPAFAIDWPIAAVSAVVGVAGAMLTASVTLRRALRTPVREALTSEGLVSGFGESRVDRAISRSGTLPPPVRIGVRNIARQKERSATTVVQIALAVATLLGLASLALAVSQVTDQSWDVLGYDITLSAQTGGHDYGTAAVNTVRAQPGVAGVEAADWSDMTYRGQTLYALGVHARTFVHEPLTAGRWLTAQDERTGARVIIAGSAFARIEGLRPGSKVVLTTAAGPVAFSVVGIGGSDANNGFNVYTTLAALQHVTGRPGVANNLLVRAVDKDHSAINALAAHLQGTLAREGYPSGAQLMYVGRADNKAQNSSVLLIVQCIGLLIVAISMFGLVNAITMNIIERTREIGVLRCLGARGRDLRRIFRTETIALAVIGFVLGIPLGWLLAHILRWLVLHVANIQLPVPYTLGNVGIALAATLVLAVLVVAAPLRRATRLRPGDAIRYR
jgi:putative ABC transport system permease protein